MTQPEIKDAQLRPTVQAVFPDGRVLEGPRGATLEAFARMRTGERFAAIAALVNGRLRELTSPLSDDGHVELLDATTSEGVRIYRRTLAFLLVAAVGELHPQAAVFVDYTVPFGGYFCQIRNRPPLSAADLAELERHMRAMVAEDLPIRRIVVTATEAKAIFAARGEHDKARIVAHRNQESCMMYQLRNRKDVFYGYMVPSTGYLACFEMMCADGGFILRYPQRTNPAKLDPPMPTSKLHAVFRQYGDWLERLRIEDFSQINDAISCGAIRETILVSEALHEHTIASIAALIAERRADVRLVLIAGPSSSGKTTFSKRLAVQLLAHGIHPFTLEMDRYFLDRDQTPRDGSGEHDFEALEALDLPRLDHDMAGLVSGDAVVLPSFNFISGRREAGPTVRMRGNQVIIAEGIHGLNPKLLPSLPHEKVFRVYVSALTQLNIDRHNRVATTDTRLIRRIVRDAEHRGWTAEDTLGMWEKVRHGEKRNIFPYQDNADAMFNSALAYELAALKPLALPLLLQVRASHKTYVAARRLIALLSLIDTIPTSHIPENSIIREFVGGSILEDYLPGKE